jgi:AcrR family transcriptional regulator
VESEVVVPRDVDVESRDRELRAATVRVIVDRGVAGVTIRRVAAELGRSTTAVTHYVADRDELLARVVGGALSERRDHAERLVADAGDALWALIEWSVQSGRDPVWPALAAAAAADVEPVVTGLVASFETWWTDLVAEVVSDRVAVGVSVPEAAAAIGVVVDGLILASDASRRSDAERRRLARMLIEPLLAR